MKLSIFSRTAEPGEPGEYGASDWAIRGTERGRDGSDDAPLQRREMSVSGSRDPAGAIGAVSGPNGSPPGLPRASRSTSSARLHPYRAARARLVAVNLLVVAGILALMAVAVYAWEVHATDQQVNDQLYQRAAQVVVEEGNAGLGLSPNQTPAPAATRGAAGADQREGSDHAAEQYEPTSPDVFTVIVNGQGVVTFDPGNVRSLGLPDAAALQPVLAGQQAATLVTLGDDQHAYRLYSLPIRQHGQLVGALQVGMSLASRYRQLHDLLLILAGVGGGVLVITAAASFYLAGRALQPMRVAYERQRRFAAAASHELRTPLAILRSEAELVARGLQRLSATVPAPPTAEPAAPVAAAPGVAADDGTLPVETQSSGGTSSPRRSAQPLRTPESPGQANGGVAARLGKDVREIIGEVDYMARLVDDLLLLARDETTPDQSRGYAVDLASVASEAVAKLEPIAGAHGLTLRFEQEPAAASVSSAALIVRGDRDRIKQLVLILLDNAIRYTPPGGAIVVTAQRAHGWHLVPRHGDLAVLSVRDTGAGITSEDLPHLFEPFYRAKSSRTGRVASAGSSGGTEKPEGAGLGLAVARWIVNAHGGTITATSEPGQGATFTVSLPLA